MAHVLYVCVQSVGVKVYFDSCLDHEEVTREALRLAAVKHEEQRQRQQQLEAATQLEIEQTTTVSS